MAVKEQVEHTEVRELNFEYIKSMTGSANTFMLIQPSVE